MTNLVQFSNTVSQKNLLNLSSRFEQTRSNLFETVFFLESNNELPEYTGTGVTPIQKYEIPLNDKDEFVLNDQVRDRLSIKRKVLMLQKKIVQDSEAYSLNWYTFFKNNHSRNLSINELSNIISGINSLITHEDWSILNRILKDTLTPNSSPESMVCLLRSTYSVSNKLSYWHTLLSNVKKWLKSKAINPDEILFGLI